MMTPALARQWPSEAAALQMKKPRRKAGASGRELGQGRRRLSSESSVIVPRWFRAKSLLNHLAVQVDVETLDLDRLADPDADQDVDDDQDHEGGEGAPDDGGEDALDLRQHLTGIAVEQAGLAADRLDGEHAGQDSADDAADRVDAEDVERVVVAEGPLDRRRGEEAADAGGDADPERARPDRQSPTPA